MRRLCFAALHLYPEAWLARYELELQALLAQRPATVATLFDILRGAIDAHLHPVGSGLEAPERLRATITSTLACWIAVVIAGSSFAKATEDVPFRAAGHGHVLLGTARTLIVVLGAATAAVVLLAGAPLLVAVLRQAYAERRGVLVKALLAPVIVVGAFAATTGVLILVAHAGAAPASAAPHPGAAVHAHAISLHPVVLAWLAFALVAAAVCVVAARAALRASDVGMHELRLGVSGATLLAPLMAALTLAVGLYDIALNVDSPQLAASANGPFPATTTTFMLTCQLAVMAAATMLTAVTVRRGRRALRPV